MTIQNTSASQTRMFTRFSWLQRRAQCAAKCDNATMEAGTAIVRTTVFKLGRRYSFLQHPDCYVRQGLAYLEQHPFVPHPGGPGRKKLKLDPETRRLRRNLHAKAVYLRKERREAINKGWWWKVEILNSDMLKLREAFEQVGGVPSNWR